ncbi:MAG TPA: NifB/NifX family molybdenum-iron cluster-binding protein [Candidatus Limiplasma sp.]|nr:NifB/NifX family molybdenum-iron cluster-binding protein [Candidatus Limiplasma sp.]
MYIAIASDGDYVSPHFGRCQTYTLVDIVDGVMKSKKEVENPGHEPGAIPRFLHRYGANRIVCGGMGARAIGFFQELGIEILTGVSGKIDAVIDELVKGTLTGSESACTPGAGRGYGIEKTECDHAHEDI